MKLGYWNLRGRAGALRLMLAYKRVEYENITYEVTKPEKSTGYPEWHEVKNSLGLDFPNLPYLIDGEAALTETSAICRYLARKLGLMPATEKEMYECDMAEGVTTDLLRSFAEAAYNPELVKMLPATREKQLNKITQVEKFLSGRQYLAGERLTFVDFAFFEIMDWHRILFPDIFQKLPNIQSYMKRFESQESIAAYFASAEYKKYPIFAPMAAWGGKDHDDRTW